MRKGGYLHRLKIQYAIPLAVAQSNFDCLSTIRHVISSRTTLVPQQLKHFDTRAAIGSIKNEAPRRAAQVNPYSCSGLVTNCKLKPVTRCALNKPKACTVQSVVCAPPAKTNNSAVDFSRIRFS